MGTPACPPRCPRYVADDGRTYTIAAADASLLACGTDRSTGPDDGTGVLGSESEVAVGVNGRTAVGTAREAAGEVPKEAAQGAVVGAPVKVETVGPPEDDTDLDGEGRDGVRPLVALDGGTVVGTADPTTEPATVTLRDGTDEAVAVELVRQLVARAIENDDSTMRVTVPSGVDDELADDLVTTRADGVVEIDLTTHSAKRTRRVPGERADIAVETDLDALFAPDRVAVVGATDREGAIGRTVVENLRQSFDGAVVPVSTSTDEILGLPAVPAVEEAAADLAVVVLPAEPAVEAVESAAAAGVDAIAVLSAGFAETGDDAGRRREDRLRTIASAHDVALVGPNALGVLSTRRDVNASFSPELPDAGGVSILSHSGAMVTATIDWALDAGVGVRDVVSLGNAAGIDEADVLRYWGADDGTDVVFAYLEDVQDGDRFVEAARAVSRTTPVVALKAGRSEAGGAAAASHTGALAGDDAGFRAAFAETGVIRATGQQEAYDLLTCLGRQPLPTGDQIGVVTNAGGPGVLAADAIAEADVELASFSPATTERLEADLPGPASVRNPVDVLGDASVDRFVDALETVLGDGTVDAAMVVSTPHPLVDQPTLVHRIGDVSRRYGKPVVTVLSGGPPDGETKDALSNAGVPNYRDAVRAARSLGAYATYAAWRRSGVPEPEPVDADRERGGKIVAEAVARGQSTLGVEAMDLLGAYDVGVPESVLVSDLPSTDEDGAAWSLNGSGVAELDGPFAVKVASPDLVHKSDVGGVRVDVPAAEVEDAVRAVVRAVRENAPDATITGVLVEELAPEGVECVVGVTEHPRFGPMVTFGLGGVLVEHLEDVAHALAPLSHEQARSLITSLEGASILEGARGAAAVDIDALAEAVVALSWLAVDEESIAEIEINPLIATPDGAVAVDLHAELTDE